MVNKFLRKYLEEKSIFDIEDRIGIVNNPLITVLNNNQIIFHSSPEDFNIKYLKYRVYNQKYGTRNSTGLYGKNQHQSCIEFLKVLDIVERILKMKKINENS